jgi:hypothetical protein
VDSLVKPVKPVKPGHDVESSVGVSALAVAFSAAVPTAAATPM